MKQNVFLAAAAIAAGTLGIGADVSAQSCTQLAESTARALAREYCETVKDADVDRIVIEPGGYQIKEELILPSQCTRTHSLICKQRMADIVGRDKYCSRLYREGFPFDFKDDFTGTTTPTDSQSFYEELQREGCRLH